MMTAKSALLPLADKTSGRGRLSGFTSHTRLAMAIAVLLCVQFTGALQAQSETAAEADARLAGEVFSAIDAGKILARSVFDKDLSKQTDVFAKAVNKHRASLLKGMTQALISKSPTPQIESDFWYTLFREETWSREIVNLKAPSLRYGDGADDHAYAAPESATLLLNGGRTKLYIEEQPHSRFAVGLLFDADSCDIYGWKYMFKADAGSSSWISSSAYPANGVPTIAQANSRESWIANEEEATPAQMEESANAITHDTVLQSLTRGQAKDATATFPMNEVLVGLRSQAIRGVFVYLSREAIVPAAHIDAVQLQAVVEGISRRQLIKKEFGLSVPLFLMPIGGGDPWPEHISLEAQKQWLVEYQRQINSGNDIGSGSKYVIDPKKHRDAKKQIAALIKTLEGEINGR